MSVTSTIAAKKWAENMLVVQRWSYWTIGLLVLGLTSYFYYSVLDRPVAGVLWFLGGFIILYYYWIKWFVLKQRADPDFNPAATGACPDYLSLIPPTSGLYKPTSNTQYFCVDYIGVSRNGGILKTNPVDIAKDIKNPTYRFSVDPAKDFRTAAGRAAFVNRLTKAGLSYNSVGDNTLPTQEEFAYTSDLSPDVGTQMAAYASMPVMKTKTIKK
jgi:hypothetical protein